LFFFSPALANLETLWKKQEEDEKKRRVKQAENKVIKKYTTRKGKKEISADAKMMRWTFHLLPRVSPLFTGFDKISYKDCKARVVIIVFSSLFSCPFFFFNSSSLSLSLSLSLS
jgi:hypothetical protein